MTRVRRKNCEDLLGVEPARHRSLHRLAGEMEMNRYVELGTPFRLVIEAHSEAETVFKLQQLERDCARITLRA